MKIGNIEFKNKLFLAPMAGVTDISFRNICQRMGVGMLYTEMVSVKGLYYGDKKTNELMKVGDRDTPTALQIFGSEADIFREIIENQLNENKNFDILDINMGCPAPKIVKNGYGSALMKEPDKVREIVRSAVRASNRPVSVKIRKGWDDSLINAVEIAKIIESEGASALTIHGRTREEFYSGRADWDIIRAVKESVKIPVIGNGDIFKPEDISAMIEHTGCDGIMIGRGARGNPWIFKMGSEYLESGAYSEPTGQEKIEKSLEHLNNLIDYKGEHLAIKEIRKHMAWYLKGLRGSTAVKDKVNKASSRSEIEHIIEEYRAELT